MKPIFLFLLAALSVNSLHAQINAITETGDEVLLYHDGTWQYANDSVSDSYAIPINETKFEKSTESTFLVKSNNLNVGIYINPKKWSFAKSNGEDAHEYEFQLKGEDLYGMLIAERLEIPIATLKGIALDNARAAAPDIRVVQEEYRTVNGLQVLMMQMVGTLQGMKISYYGYYFSNENGTIQLLTYTGQNLQKHYQEEVDKFLNGFVQY